MKRRLLPRSIRSRLLLAVVAAVAVALAATIAGFNLLLRHSLSRNADQVLHARAAAQLAQLDPVGGRLVVAEAPDERAADSPVWVFAGGRVLEAPRVGETLTRAARSLVGGPPRTLGVPALDARLYAVPVVSGGRRLGTVVAAVSLAPYEQTERTALIGSLALGALLLLLVALAARWLLASSLSPVQRMTRQAAVWSERDLERRFSLGEPHDEVTELAATLDTLLDRLAASLRREQRFSSELSHELRTPLSRIVGQAELALHRDREPGAYREALEAVLANARSLAQTVDSLVAAARHEAQPGHGTADAYEAARRTVEVCSDLAEERGLKLVVEKPPTTVRVGIERELAERILQPLVENACRYAAGHVRISVVRTTDEVRYVVADDGPGVVDAERELIFEPGRRGTAARLDGAPTGAGLGLALARRLARSATGDVAAETNGAGGRFLVSLPAA